MSSRQPKQIVGLSDIGQLRHVNEDAVLVDQALRLYAVADGMGGHGSGDIASQLALDTLQSCIAAESVSQELASDKVTDEQALTLVFQAVAATNRRIFQENEKNGHPDGTGMGTTLVGLCQFGNAHRAILFNVGDSRAYEFNNHSLAQLTKDHTMYREWEDAGGVGPAPPRNLIMRAMGLFPDVDIDIEVLELAQRARYLLCSDGLTGMVPDDDIEKILTTASDATAAGESLIRLANDNGGADNISVVLLSAN